MKKHCLIGLSCAFFAISGCSKKSDIFLPETKNQEIIPETSNSYRSSTAPCLISGRLVFQSETAFNEALCFLDNNNKDEWEASLDFLSARSIYISGLTSDQLEEFNELPIDDGSLMSVLNEFNIVQIGDWIFKLNGGNQTVYALHINHLDQIELLKAERPEPNENIHLFSFDDDVFYLIENGNYRSGNGCGATCASNEAETLYPLWENYCEKTINGESHKYKIFLKSKYFTGGITRKLFTEFKHRKRNSNGSDYTHFSIQYSANWTTKCQGFGDAAQTFTFSAPGQPVYDYYDKDREWIHYRASRCLSQCSISTSVLFENACESASGNSNITLYRSLAFVEAF